MKTSSRCCDVDALATQSKTAPHDREVMTLPLAQLMGSGFDHVTPSSALKLNRGDASLALESISAQLSALHVRALTPSPSGGGVTIATVSPVASKRHKRSRPDTEPPKRHCVAKHVVEVISGDVVEGRARFSHGPFAAVYSPTEVGPAPALEVPTATQTSFSVQPTFESGTEMLSAGLPLKR
jgi:hypothetical protein